MDEKQNYFEKNGKDGISGTALWRRWIAVVGIVAVLMICLSGCRLPISEDELTPPSTIPDPTDMEHTAEPPYDPTNFEEPIIDLIIENPELSWE